jgi:FAD/FMN-containing dehydrogenase
MATTRPSVRNGEPSSQEVEKLRESMRGPVITPVDAEYEGARRVWNGTIDKRPAAVAACHGVSDVIEAVNFAREQGLRVSVRGGGHNVAGTAVGDGGLVVDLSGLNFVHVDPATRRVRVGGGARLGDLDRETQVFGLAVPSGLVTDTGVAGLTLGGGLGWMRRKYGLGCDSLISVDVVTADGRAVTASARENTDLFWALRGGGGGFGVVTSFEFQAYPLGPDVFLCFVFYPFAKAREALEFFREYTAHAPDEVGLIAVCMTTPDAEPIPVKARSQKAVGFAAPYIGPPDEGERVLRPVRELSTPLADLSGVLPWTSVQMMFDEDYPTGRRYYWKSAYLKGLDDPTIDRIVKYGSDSPSPLSTVDIWHLGGAISRPREDTAAPHRDAPYLLGFESNWEDSADDEANIGWTRRSWQDVQPFSTGGLYVNFPGYAEEETFGRLAFGDHLERLEVIKQKYDPTGLFA